MKELSTEEKAKRYDEVIAMAKECITHIPDEAVNKYMLNMFPELQEKESEDERIIKVLVDYFKTYKRQEECGIKTFFGIPTDNIIAWLEKQGEQKPQGKSALEAFKEGAYWHINIENLEGLMKLIEKEGSIIISSPESPVIEIYDDYRE